MADAEVLSDALHTIGSGPTRTRANEPFHRRRTGTATVADDLLPVDCTVADDHEGAHDGGGTTPIETVTCRRGAHSTTDDPAVYRDVEDGQDRRGWPGPRRPERADDRAPPRFGDRTADDGAAVRE